MIFTQFVDDALGCASYLVGDPGTGEAVVVDPAFAIEQYLEEAERRDVRIVRAIETHTHADHLSGHGRLALEHGVPVSIHPAAEAEYPHDPMRDGEEIVLGDIVLRCIHTPGHRPEHCCLAVSDRSRGDDPWIVLTGDSLFVGDAARPDLAVEAREGAEGLFHSLRRLVELGDGVEVYPGHVAGSLCGKAMSSKASTTIGFERRFNPALAHDDVAAVHRRVRRHLDAASAEHGADRGAEPRPVRRRAAGARRSSPRRRTARRSSTCGRSRRSRPDITRARSASRSSGTRFSTKAAFVLDAGAGGRRRLRRGRGRASRSAGLRSVGFLDIAGYVLGGGPEPLELVSIEQLDALLETGAELIDVREKDERDTGYIAGSRNIPYRLLALGEADLPRDRPIVTICETGPRAAIAASILAARRLRRAPGRERRHRLLGGRGGSRRSSSAAAAARGLMRNWRAVEGGHDQAGRRTYASCRLEACATRAGGDPAPCRGRQPARVNFASSL